MRRSIAATCFLALAAFEARAAEPARNLDDQPAVRKRIQLRENRLELGPTFGITLGQPFRHTLLAGVRAQYHILDWVAAGAVFTFGAASFDTGLTKEIDSVNEASIAGCDPKKDSDDFARCLRENGIRGEEEADWKNALNETAWTLAIRGTITPFSGKMAFFSRLFWLYDFYAFAGVGIVKTKNSSDADLGNDGTHVGPHIGLGLHVFFLPSLALSAEFSDTIIKNNPSGRNIDLSVDEGCTVVADCDRVNGDDARTSGYYTVLLGINAYLPWTAKRTK